MFFHTKVGSGWRWCLKICSVRVFASKTHVFSCKAGEGWRWAAAGVVFVSKMQVFHTKDGMGMDDDDDDDDDDPMAS